MDALDHRATLARNVRRLMDSSPDLNKQLRLAKRAGIGQATVDRILRADAGVSIDSIAAIAKAFGVSPWLLLHPNPPLAAAEAEFYAKMRGLFDTTAK